MKKSLFAIVPMLAVTALCLSLGSCRGEDPITPSDPIVVNPWERIEGDIEGFYLLGEGTMGSNNATLDYYDYRTGTLLRDIYGERNPDEALGLGDTGNDLKIYGSKLYAVLNGSNYLEVMDAATARHITKIAIPNPRYVAFSGGYAYVTSFDDYVAKIDTVTLREVARCDVGPEPEELAVVGDRMFVANSGGYAAGYDRTVSIIDLGTFTEIKKIDVAPNPWRIRPDADGRLYVSSRGNYADVAPTIHIIDTETDEVVSTLPVVCNGIAIRGNRLYVFGVSYDAQWNATNSYTTIDTASGSVEAGFITDGTETDISSPYGIAIHPKTGDILITDAGYFTDRGTLRCYSSAGVLKWSVPAGGTAPAHIAFRQGASR